jgi:hypothetical protein
MSQLQSLPCVRHSCVLVLVDFSMKPDAFGYSNETTKLSGHNTCLDVGVHRVRKPHNRKEHNDLRIWPLGEGFITKFVLEFVWNCTRQLHYNPSSLGIVTATVEMSSRRFIEKTQRRQRSMPGKSSLAWSPPPPRDRRPTA